MKLSLIQADITKLQVDVIVNAANSSLLQEAIIMRIIQGKFLGILFIQSLNVKVSGGK